MGSVRWEALPSPLAVALMSPHVSCRGPNDGDRPTTRRTHRPTGRLFVQSSRFVRTTRLVDPGLIRTTGWVRLIDIFDVFHFTAPIHMLASVWRKNKELAIICGWLGLMTWVFAAAGGIFFFFRPGFVSSLFLFLSGNGWQSPLFLPLSIWACMCFFHGPALATGAGDVLPGGARQPSDGRAV